MAKGPFKMKGSPMARNFGIGSPLTKLTEPTVKKGDDLSVANWKTADSDYDQMKRDIAAEGGAEAKLATRYGGTWTKKKDRYGRETLRNEDNRTVQDVESTFLNPPS
jgi:hypothetical protein